MGGMSGRSVTVCWDGFVAYDVGGEEWRGCNKSQGVYVFLT